VPSLHVTTVTTGVEQDPDGYSVVVDGGAGRQIGLASSIQVGSLGDGPHTVELRDVATNCAVQGSNPRSAQVTSGSTAEVGFVIECRPTTGGIRVTTTTTGLDQDEDGYVVVIEGDARETDANGSITYGEMPAGSRVVELLGVVANCTADTPTFTRVTVTGGDTVEVAFGFTCTTRQPNTGTLQVTTTTTGPSPDPDGYEVSVDDGVPSVIPPTGSVLFPGVAAGTRIVAISGVAANCAVAGANPKSVTVTGTAVAVLPFAIVCTTPPPTTGTLRVTTATGGADPDPNGYALAVDGGTAQPIGRNAIVSISSLSAGSHALLLSDVAANCTVGDNPRTVMIPAGSVADVTFTVTCVPATGTIATTTVTTGASLDVDGYVARVDGGAGKEIPVNGTVTRAGLVPGAHTVKLDNVAANCQVQGENPQSVVVAGNATTAVTFTVICAATTGTLAVTVAGLPPGAAAAVTVTGPANYSASVPGNTTLLGLAPGQYTVNAADVTVAPDTYTPSSRQQVVDVSAGGSPAVTVTYSRGPGGSVNLRIGGMYITQATQTLHDSVPLVKERDGYLRVFVVASQENSIAPAVRVRLYQNGTLVSTLRIAAPAASTPTLVQESSLGASWNVRLPGSLIQPGLAVLADVDPDAQVSESNETDNAFPVNGSPMAMAVRRASPFAVRLVPVQVGSGGLTGDVSSATIDQFLEPTLRRFPLPGYDAPGLHQ
jgi:hypothetical protein